MALTRSVFPVLWKDKQDERAVGLKGIALVDMHGILQTDFGDAKVRDLISTLNNRRLTAKCDNLSREVTSITLYGVRLKSNYRLGCLLPELSAVCPRLVATTRVTDRGGKIFVAMIGGKKLKLSVLWRWTVFDLKLAVQEMEGIPPDQQRLFFSVKVLANFHRLEEYNIRDGSQLFLVVRPTGGSSKMKTFADVSDGSILRAYEFSDRAPKWRVCSEGLNVEGRCNKPGCRAFSKLFIHMHRWQPFNLIQERGIRCPMCLSIAKPITCGFYNCLWKFEGVKASDKLLVSSSWKEARGEKYHRFDASESHDSINWNSLLISVMPVSEEKRTSLLAGADYVFVEHSVVCAICWSEFDKSDPKEQKICTLSCGHPFHLGCIEKWTPWCQQRGAVLICPVCRKESDPAVGLR